MIDKEAIEKASNELKEALKGDNVDDIKKKTEALKQASYKIAEEMYKQQAAQGAAGGAGPNPGSSANTSSDAGKTSGFDKGSAEDVQYEVHDDK